MQLWKTKKEIPTGETQIVEVLKSWIVKWKSFPRASYHGENQAEFFLDEEKAKDFKKALIQAETLLKNGNPIEVTITENI